MNKVLQSVVVLSAAHQNLHDVVQLGQVHFKRLVLGAAARRSVPGHRPDEVVRHHDGAHLGWRRSHRGRAGAEVVHGRVNVCEEDVVQGKVCQEGARGGR